MFLDEAVWRIKFKKPVDRLNCLVQLNAYTNFETNPESYIFQSDFAFDDFDYSKVQHNIAEQTT